MSSALEWLCFGFSRPVQCGPERLFHQSVPIRTHEQDDKDRGGGEPRQGHTEPESEQTHTQWEAENVDERKADDPAAEYVTVRRYLVPPTTSQDALPEAANVIREEVE